MSKAELMQELDAAYAEMKAGLSGLTEGQMAQVWLGTWGVREILAHVLGWHKEMTLWFERMAQGLRPTPDGADYGGGINDRFVEERRSMPPSQMVSEYDAAFARLRSAADALPEDRFDPERTAGRTTKNEAIGHTLEHAHEIRDWRKSQGI